MFAKRLYLLAAAFSITTVGCKDIYEHHCSARLRIQNPADNRFAYVGDERTFSALWDGNADGCPTDFRWRFTGAWAPEGSLMGAMVKARANSAGVGAVTVNAGPNDHYKASLDIDVRRIAADLDLSFHGLDSGVRGRIDLIGPFPFNKTFVEDTLLTDLPPGQYRWILADVRGGAIGHRYAGNPAEGNFELTRDNRFSLSVEYQRKTGQLDFEATGVDTLANGAFAEVRGPDGFRHTLAPRVSVALEPGRYSWSAKPVDPAGFDFVPQDTAGTFDINSLNPFRLNIGYTATKGRLDVKLLNGPADAKLKAKVTSQDGRVRDIDVPTSTYLGEGTWHLSAGGSLDRKVDGIVQLFEAQQGAFDVNINLGKISSLDIPLRLKSSYSDFAGPINVKFNPFNHPIGMTSPAQWRVEWVTETPQTDKVTITSSSPWVTVTGVRQTDGSLTASGSGVVAGYPNVPVTFIGKLKGDGTLTGDYQMGKDTAPTGLPGGSITFSLNAVRVTN